MILGLDISTTCIGFCVYSDHLEEYGFVKFKPKYTKFEKWSIMEIKLAEIKKSFQIDEVFIEEALLMFQKGRSKPRVLATLKEINGVISWICLKVFEKEPKYISANKARSLNQVQKIDEENGKEAAFRRVCETEPTFKVEFNRNGNIKKEMMDASDAIIVAKAGRTMLYSRKNARQKNKPSC